MKDPAQLPDKIGRYQILERVGRGGMGVLYRGFDPVLDREVAVKVMLTDFSDDTEQMRPRFYREAKAAAKLQHRNIVTVFEFAEEDNQPHIVMEFLRGVPLGARMAATPPLTLDDKLEIVAQLCAGLGYAHSQGVVHRDVKPANVFLLADGTVKLLDFGIAKLATSTLTRQGDVLGSASYMSPEQVAGSDSVDGRADVWSAGVVLYELLAGRKPFEGDSPTNVIVKILKDQPPPIETLVPGLPKQLAALVGRALEKDPAKRITRAEELGRELQWIRKALQASGDLAPMEDTRYASTQVLKALHDDLQRAPTGTIGSRTMTGMSDAAAPSGRTVSLNKWLLPAGIAAAALVVGAAAWAFFGGSGGDGGRPDTPIAAPARPASNETVTLASANPAGSPTSPVPPGDPAAALRPAASAPAGTPPATIPTPPVAGGRSTAAATPSPAKPAPAPVSAAPPRPTPRADAPPSVQKPLVAEIPRPAAPATPAAPPSSPAPAVMVAVSMTATYPFEVFDGSRSLSAPGRAHELSPQPNGKVLRIVAPDVFLDRSVRVERGADGRFTYSAPELGKLEIRSQRGDCKTLIGKRELESPPLTVAAVEGDYEVILSCPDGQNPRYAATVTRGRTASVRFLGK